MTLGNRKEHLSGIAGLLFYISVSAAIKVWNTAIRSTFGGRILGWIFLCMVALICLVVACFGYVRFTSWLDRIVIVVMLSALMAFVYLCICERIEQ